MKKVNLRLGFTESTLLYIYYMNNIKKCIQYEGDDYYTLKRLVEELITWLYNTSGYYNKNDNLANMTFETLHSNDHYINYMNKLVNAIKKSNVCCFALHKLPDKYYVEYIHFFNAYLNYKLLIVGQYTLDFKNLPFDYNSNCLYIINNSKNILVVNPLAELIVSQFNNNNVFHVNKPNNSRTIIPKAINKFIGISNKSTFFNNGPDNNNIETFEKLCEEINKVSNDYETAIISCGSYSLLIADYISKLHKNVIVLGGSEINALFGIKHKRFLDSNPNFVYNEHWIDVPEELKPDNYKKIEDGCYW